MVNPDAQLIEKYEVLLKKEPKSKVFAPLCEAYRKLGLNDDAMNICREGLKHNPEFSGGRIAMARLYIDKQNWSAATEQLERATRMDPNNILAHNLLGQGYLHLKRPKDALKAYKMTLLLSPDHKQAQKAVKKLESLTADEYDDEIFSMKSLDKGLLDELTPPLEKISPEKSSKAASRNLERFISLTDAYIARNDFERAKSALAEAERHNGPSPEIEKRYLLIENWQEEDLNTDDSKGTERDEALSPLPNRKQLYRDENIRYLQGLLDRVSERKRQLNTQSD